MLNSISTNNAILLIFKGILDDVRAFITNFAKLTDFVGKSGGVNAGEFYLIGETFVKVMAAECAVFVKLLTH
jgi:hypothetical protein